MRIALSLEYDGSHYWGWQRQRDCASVQATVEAALSRVAAEPIAVFCAGRTDKSVHATCQIIHFETERERSEHEWTLGANTYLPKHIRVHWAQPVADDFHARFSAQSRRYCYVLQIGSIAPGILAPYVSWRRCQDLDDKAMATAAASLLGQHDFSSFRAAECQAKTPIRTLSFCKLRRQENLFIFEIEADGFLHHMVRNIMGALLEIGLGNQGVSWIDHLLTVRDRCQAARIAPPNGLYLMHVGYPERFHLPVILRRPLFLL